MTINSYFDKVFVINLDRRTDRLAQAQAEAAKYGIEFERHPGVEVEYDTGRVYTPEEVAARVAQYGLKLDGIPQKPWGQFGTTQAHRMLIRKIVDGPWKRALILEDDFYVLVSSDKPEWFNAGPAPHPFQERFDYLVKHVPDDWDILYLGGGYGGKPLARINAHCVRADLMLTTSSYGITKSYATLWSDRVDSAETASGNWNGVRYMSYPGAIDCLLSTWAKEFKHYVIQPRMIIQRPDYSDATQRQESYLFSMTDGNHEAMV